MISGKGPGTGSASEERAAPISPDKCRVSINFYNAKTTRLRTCHTSPSKFSQYPFLLNVLRKVPCIYLPVLIAPGTLPCETSAHDLPGSHAQHAIPHASQTPSHTRKRFAFCPTSRMYIRLNLLHFTTLCDHNVLSEPISCFS
jgi:hypothetical protein